MAAWRRAEALDASQTWRDALRLVHGLTGLGELPHFLPSPSRWGSRRHDSPGRSPDRAAPPDALVLGRIRGLLAKAEPTEFPERVTDDAARSAGADLVPLMRARSEAVDQAAASLFPRLQAKETRAVDARGWYAGRAAADDAVLGSRRPAVAE